MGAYLFHAVLAVLAVAAVIASVAVVRARRHARQIQEQNAELAYVELYAKDASGTFVVVGHTAQASQEQAPARAQRWLEGKAKVFAYSLCMLLVFLSPLLFIEPAEAGLSQAMKGIFNGELKSFVDGIMSDTGGPVFGFAKVLFLIGSVLLFIIEITRFIQKGGDAAEANLQAVLWWFTTAGLMVSYNAATSAIWGAAVGISDGYQEHLVGNTDNFFLAQWIHKAMAAVVVEDISIFDTVRMWVYYVIWMFVGFLLDMIASLAAMWADFGYALSKVVGVIFIPFLLLPATRNLFDAWFKFFIGFGFLLIVLKATMVVAAISIKAIMTSLGVSFSGDYGEPAEVVQIGLDNMYMLSDASAMLFIAALFVLSSFAFAGILAGGVGNLSGGLGTAASMVARKFLK